MSNDNDRPLTPRERELLRRIREQEDAEKTESEREADRVEHEDQVAFRALSKPAGTLTQEELTCLRNRVGVVLKRLGY
jgi:hypothetical protein